MDLQAGLGAEVIESTPTFLDPMCSMRTSYAVYCPRDCKLRVD